MSKETNHELTARIAAFFAEQKAEKQAHHKVTPHILKRLPRKGGNQWRLSTVERVPVTYCGAPITGEDLTWNATDRDIAWKAEHRAPVCGECLKLRERS